MDCTECWLIVSHCRCHLCELELTPWRACKARRMPHRVASGRQPTEVLREGQPPAPAHSKGSDGTGPFRDCPEITTAIYADKNSFFYC